MYRFFSVYLFVFLLLPFVLVGYQDYLPEVWIIVQVVVWFYIGGLFARFAIKKDSVVDYKSYYSPVLSVLWLIFIIYLGLRSIKVHEFVVELISGDVAVWLLNNAKSRYDGTEVIRWYDHLGMAFFFIFCSLYGALGSNLNRFRYHFALFLAVFIESLSLARAGVLIGGAFIVVELVIRYNRVLETGVGVYLKYGAMVIVGLSVVFVFSAYFRLGPEEDVVVVLISKLSAYTVAMYEAALIWLEGFDFKKLTYGYCSFTALFKIFGAEYQQGFYVNVDTRYGATNIYTSMRGFLSDFGVLGASLYFFVSGFVLAMYSRIPMGPIAYLVARVFMMGLLFILYSPYLFTITFIAQILSSLILLHYTFRWAPGLLSGNDQKRDRAKQVGTPGMI